MAHNGDLYNNQDALDSDDLMSWLLLNPEIVGDFDDSLLTGTPDGPLPTHGFHYYKQHAAEGTGTFHSFPPQSVGIPSHPPALHNQYQHQQEPLLPPPQQQQPSHQEANNQHLQHPHHHQQQHHHYQHNMLQLNSMGVSTTGSYWDTSAGAAAHKPFPMATAFAVPIGSSSSDAAVPVGMGSGSNSSSFESSTLKRKDHPSDSNSNNSSSKKEIEGSSSGISGAKKGGGGGNGSGDTAARKRHREMSYEEAVQKYNNLKKENMELQAHYNDVTHRTTEVQKQRLAMERLMTSKFVEMGDSDDKDQSAELADILKQYTDIYADYGKCRQREVSFHLNQIEKLIVPTRTTKMLLWTLQQEKSFFLTSKSPLFEMLSRDLEITPEQSEKIQERRERVLELLSQLKESLGLLEQLKDLIEKKHMCYDAVCGRVQEAGTPRQNVRFLLWLAKNYKILGKHIPPNYPSRESNRASASSRAATVAASAAAMTKTTETETEIEAGRGGVSNTDCQAISVTNALSYMANPTLQELVPTFVPEGASTSEASSSSSSSASYMGSRSDAETKP